LTVVEEQFDFARRMKSENLRKNASCCGKISKKKRKTSTDTGDGSVFLPNLFQ